MFYRNVSLYLLLLPSLALAVLMDRPTIAAEDFSASLEAARLFRGQKQSESALRELDVARSQAANDTERGLAIGSQAEIYAYDLKDLASARKAAKAVVELKDADAVARVIGLKVLAQCQMSADQDFGAAIETLKRAADLEGVPWAQPSVALMLGDCYRETGRPHDALAAYRDVVQMPSSDKPMKATAYLNGGLTFQYDLRQRDRAKVLYAKAVELTAGLKGEVDRHLAQPDCALEPLIFAHYMPWYEAKPISQAWGWHWTMNHFDPEKLTDGKREIASHFYPLIGPYDSGDPHVLEYHLLTMKLAGIDGVIVDWYGLQDFNDYALLHRNTQRLVEQVERLGMKFAICYEDQTIPLLINAGKLRAEDRVAHAVRELDWLAQHWFSLTNYVRVDGKPILLSFGQTGLTDDEWSQCFQQVKSQVTYFSQHHRRTAAVGAFDWPVPSEALKAFERFYNDARGWPRAIPVAFPRFVDIYAEAEVSSSYGRLDDDNAASFRKMLELGLKSKAPVVQIATWNDWGEGTIIEPSREFGYRDLEIVQQLRRRHVDPQFAATADDLRLPLQLYKQRRAAVEQRQTEQCDRGN